MSGWNFDEIARLLVTLVILSNLGVAINIIYQLVSGSYKQYAKKRAEHLEQVRRVQKALQKGSGNGT